jgi:hypothetical protein
MTCDRRCNKRTLHMHGCNSQASLLGPHWHARPFPGAAKEAGWQGSSAGVPWQYHSGLDSTTAALAAGGHLVVAVLLAHADRRQLALQLSNLGRARGTNIHTPPPGAEPAHWLDTCLELAASSSTKQQPKAGRPRQPSSARAMHRSGRQHTGTGPAVQPTTPLTMPTAWYTAHLPRSCQALGVRLLHILLHVPGGGQRAHNS